MFSRNCFNGQDGVGTQQYGRHKHKATVPKRRAPNPRVALMLRGKIHRLLQGSGEQASHNPCPYYAGILEEDEGEEKESTEADLRRYVSQRERYGRPDVTNGQVPKEHAALAGMDYVGEVELNREGCVRIPCTLQHSSVAQPVRTPKPAVADFNGSRFLEEMGPNSGASFNYSAVREDRIVEEDEEEEEEEESSAIVEHILKELRGINKIQAEISDLREYLTSVRGSVDEVSSCVEAVLMEIEGMRSGSKPAMDSWSGTVGLKEGCSDLYHEKCSSPYDTRMDKSHTTDSLCAARDYQSQAFSVHNQYKMALNQPSDNKRFGSVYEDMCISSNVESPNPDIHVSPELEAFDQSSDIHPGSRVRKMSFGYLERQDGQDCPSTSSLSSGQSSKSESDPDRLEPGCPTENLDWTQMSLPRRNTDWREEDGYFRQGSFEDGNGGMEEGDTWERCRDDEACSTLGRSSAGSSDRLSFVSSRHYNSPASTSSREEWLSTKRRAQKHDVEAMERSTEDIMLQCAGSTHYIPTEMYKSEMGDFAHSGDMSHGITGTMLSQGGNNTFSSDRSLYHQTPEAFLPDQSHTADAAQQVSTLEEVERSVASSVPSVTSSAPPDSADASNTGFNVKRIGRAVLDFKSVLWVALKKLEGAQSPGDKTEATLVSSPSSETLIETPCATTPNEGRVAPEGVSCSPVPTDLTGTAETADPGVQPPCEVPQEKNADPPEDLQSAGAEPPPCTGTSSVSSPPDLSSAQGYTTDSVPCSPPAVEDHAQREEENVLQTPKETPVDADVEMPEAVCAEISENFGEDTSAAVGADTDAEASTETITSIETSTSAENTENRDANIGSGLAGPEEGADCPQELSQRDVRRLKCMRSFQQILREKRETRRNLTLMTMSTFSEDDFNPGMI